MRWRLDIPKSLILTSIWSSFIDRSQCQEQPTILQGFTFIDIDNNVDYQTISDWDVFNHSSLEDINLSVRVDVPFDLASKANVSIANVVIDFNNGAIVRYDTDQPYVLGDQSADGTTTPLSSIKRIGLHTIKATAYDSNNVVLDDIRATYLVQEDTPVFNSAGDAITPSPSPKSNNDIPGYTGYGVVQGILKKWHKLTIGFKATETAEYHPDNPFLNFRLDVTFTHKYTGVSYTVPGYYACDGNAANTGSWSGNYWLVHFVPNEIGEWQWTTSYTAGPNVSIYGGGTTGKFFDGQTGSFVIESSDKTGRDLRGKGRLQHVKGSSYLRFSETGEYFLKVGTASPTNFLAYAEFDGTSTATNTKTWEAHIQDYVEDTDQTWANGKGKGILGAINYLSSKGVNALSLVVNDNDDGLRPFASATDHFTVDCSKLAQWEIVFDHADRMGMMIHLKLQVPPSPSVADAITYEMERKFLYRELIARFAHHLAIQWNIGAEGASTLDNHKKDAEYIRSVDPYHNPIVTIITPEQEKLFVPLIGDNNFDGASLKTSYARVYNFTRKWVSRSTLFDNEWVVTSDYQTSGTLRGAVTDKQDPTRDTIRQKVLWGTFMSGGAGVEYFLGTKNSSLDMNVVDFRLYETLWDQSRYALEFFQTTKLNLAQLVSDTTRVVSGDALCLTQNFGVAFVLYVKNPTSNPVEVNLVRSSGYTYTVKWYNPRQGGSLVNGSVTALLKGVQMSIGVPPGNDDKDWVALLLADLFWPNESSLENYLSSNVLQVDPSTNVTPNTTLIDGSAPIDILANNGSD